MTERRELRKLLEHHTDLTQDSIDYLADLIIALFNDTRPPQPGPMDADRIYRTITGQFMIPNDDRRQTNVEVITSMLRELGEPETMRRMKIAWGSWVSSRSVSGSYYSKLNTKWIDRAMVEDAQPIQKAEQAPTPALPPEPHYAPAPQALRDLLARKRKESEAANALPLL